MSTLQERFKAIIAEIEERITNPEELDFVKNKVAEVSMLYLDELNRMMDLSERRVNKVYENQRIIENRIVELEKGFSTIEKELFVEDDYDFEIICPYCNHEFLTDIDSSKKEIECPECHNTIELDWNHDEDACGGECSSCGGCGHDHEEFEEDDDYEEEQDEDM